MCPMCPMFGQSGCLCVCWSEAAERALPFDTGAQRKGRGVGEGYGTGVCGVQGLHAVSSECWGRMCACVRGGGDVGYVGGRPCCVRRETLASWLGMRVLEG
eukprot:7317076-Prymnesium_polylepis.1